MDSGNASPELAARAANDPHYPRFHVASPGGWMNDPHPIYFKGAHHMLYQYSFMPDAPYAGPHRWGHVVSPDLLRWEHLPAAITPKDHGIAEDRHIWSGCLVDDDGTGVAIYTIENIDIWVATSEDDDLRTFGAVAENPVIKGPPPGLPLPGGMRDPWVWEEDDGWYLIVGSGLENEKGLVLPLYRSADLIEWEYLHPLYEGDIGKGEGGFCECPSFFPLGDKYVLVISHECQYLVGRYEGHRFVPETRGRLDHGWVYVPQFVLDDKGRRIMWAWVREAQDPEVVAKTGWASMQTLPRVLTLRPDGTLAFEPAEELAALRRDHREFGRIAVGSDPVTLAGVGGEGFEIDATFRPGTASRFGLVFREGPTTVEILYDVQARTLCCKGCTGYTAALELGDNGPLTLRVFFDRSVVEVHANETVCITERTYPSDPDGMTVELVAANGEAVLERADAWRIDAMLVS